MCVHMLVCVCMCTCVDMYTLNGPSYLYMCLQVNWHMKQYAQSACKYCMHSMSHPGHPTYVCVYVRVYVCVHVYTCICSHIPSTCRAYMRYILWGPEHPPQRRFPGGMPYMPLLRLEGTRRIYRKGIPCSHYCLLKCVCVYVCVHIQICTPILIFYPRGVRAQPPGARDIKQIAFKSSQKQRPKPPKNQMDQQDICSFRLLQSWTKTYAFNICCPTIIHWQTRLESQNALKILFC